MDSDEEREEETVTWRGVSGVVVLINVFDPLKKGTASVSHAASCRMVRQYLRTSNAHNMGVCLYGTEVSTPSAFSSKNVLEVFPLSVPTLDDFKKLRSIDISACKQVKELEFSDVLWHCSKMFANCKKLLSSRTVLILTRLDTPPVQSDQKPTLKRVVDLVDSNIDIRIINIAEEEYEVDPFYKNFLIEANKGKDYILPQPIWDLKEIEQVMHQQSHRHLAVAHLNFEIGNGFAIGVGVYNLLIRSGSQNYQKKITLDRESNAVVTSVTKVVKVTTETSDPGISAMDVDEEVKPKEMPLLKSEILYCQNYGGENVEFTSNEKKKLQNPFGPPMMKLLGFKPANIMCKEKWFLKTGYFLFPHESAIEGSTVAFKALHQACVETSVVAICVLCARVNSKPNIVALSPCTHPLGLDVEIGFDVVHIPFMENVRNLPPVEEDAEPAVISEEQKTLMKDILRTVRFDYKPNMFENPKLQSKQRAIEAIALDEENLDPFIDTTKPDSEKFQSIPEDLFEELFGPFGPVAPKRSATSKESGPVKRSKDTDELDETFINDRVKHKTVHRYNMTQLRTILRNKSSNLPPLTGLKKNELVDLVYKHYGEN